MDKVHKTGDASISTILVSAKKSIKNQKRNRNGV